MNQLNTQVRLAARPQGWPGPEHFQIVRTPLPEPGEGEALVEVLYVSVDPYLRGRMRERKSYIAPIPLGGVMEAGAVARVVRSRSAELREGDIIEGMFGWQEYAVTGKKGTRRIDPALAPVSTALGVLGMPGLTAYFGMTEILQARAGQSVLVSGAAGAVGSVAGQIGKLLGCRVAGIAGGAKKVKWLVEELGFDAAYDYKTEADHRGRIAEVCPGGVDGYFDNVGGEISDGALLNLNERGRVAVCGQISQYNLEKPEMGPRLTFQLILKRARMEGFLVFDFREKYAEALERMAGWVKEGKLKWAETVVEGVEHAPEAFVGMMRGENVGKMVVKVR